MAVNLPNRPGGTIYRILASQNNTTVTQDGVSIGTINRGQFLETLPLSGSHFFAGNNPILVVQFMTGVFSPGATLGDPAMGNMIPPEQYLSHYTFSTVGGNQFVQNFLTIIADNADVGTSVRLDGNLIPAASFTAIGATGFSAAVLPLTDGTHTTSSTRGHGITVEGYNDADSYLYPGGALFQFINPVGDANPPLCSGSILSGPPPSFQGTAMDNRPSEDTNNNGVLDPGEDLNNNSQIDEDTGIFFVVLEASASNLTLAVNPFVPGDGTGGFTVNLTDPNLPGIGTVRATDGAGNVCSLPVNLGAARAVCDADGNGDIDRNDINSIFAARNTAASGPTDPRDFDGNGTITVNDSRACVLRCTNGRWASFAELIPVNDSRACVLRCTKAQCAP